MSEPLTLSQINQRRIPINGKARSLPTLKKMVIEEQVPNVGLTQDNFKAKLYDVDTLTEAHKVYNEKKHGREALTKESKTLVEQKLQEQIDRLKQDKVLADLKIQEMQKDLIPSEEVKRFLQFRYEVENAILRRILFINAPIEITGLTIPQSRKKLEDYYNSIQEVMKETLDLYQADSDLLNERINNIIERFNNALLPKVTTEDNQGSIG